MSAAPQPLLPSGRAGWLQYIARASVVVAAAWIAFASSVISAFMLLALVCWALAGQWRATLRAVAAEPVAWASLALFAALAAGVAWTRAPLVEALQVLGKYRELAFVAIVMFLFAEARWRRRLFIALFVSGVALLAASYIVYFQWVPWPEPLRFAREGAVVMKNSITHSFLMSLLAYAATCLALHERGARRWALAGIAVLAVLNVLIAVQSRTGYVVLCVLALWLAASRWSGRGFAVAALGLMIVGSAAYLWAPGFQSGIHKRVAQVVAGPAGDSVQQRLQFWRHSVLSTIDRPVLGSGTGGWREAFYESTAGGDPFFHSRRHEHPHNEYLHFAVQLGVGGLALFIAMFAFAFVRAGALPGDEALFARGVVLAFAAGSLFNDFMLDTTEGHLWALLAGAIFAALPGRAAPAASAAMR